MNRLLLSRRALFATPLTVIAGAARMARAQTRAPKVTVIDPLVWLRPAPSFAAGNVAAVRKGEFYDVTARSSDALWLRVTGVGAGGQTAWMPAAHAALTEGDIKSLPVVQAPAAPAVPVASGKAAAARAAFPAWVPAITARQRAIYQAAARAGKDPAMFTVIGDCNSQPAVYLRRISTGEYDVSRIDPRLQRTVARFAPAFGRISLAAKGGFGTAAMLDPLWADGALCGTKQGPFECEVWVSRASIVFIELGTGDQLAWQNFENNYRPLIKLALAKGALPVLVTKADDIEVAGGATSGFLNAIIRKLAREYEVPLLDFHAATRALPNLGLLDEGDKDFHLSEAGIYRHIECTLQTLTAIAG
jgi:hypothetical protein